MDFNSSFNDDSWLYNGNNPNNNSNSEFNNETLQEPVPFEDFKFSFGINSDLSNASLTDLQQFQPSLIDPFLQEPFNFMTPATNTVLDENDQKAFSSFLDAFFMDPDMQFQQNNQGNTSTSDFYSQYNENDEPLKEQEDEEEHRRSSILQSLDEQKMLHQRLNLLATLPTATANNNKSTADHSRKRIRSPSVNNTTGSVTSISEDDNNTTPQTIYLRQSHSISSPYTINTTNTITSQNPKKRSSSSAQLYASNEKENSKSNHGTTKKARNTKELLTEEEKRANHIASEQKRRSTIRTGFKDLTDLIPTLKNINNSKSTVLFKAVDFIRYLEKRNKGLREKVGSLELRVEVEGRMTQTTNNNAGVFDNKQLFGANDSSTHESDNKEQALPFSAELPPLTPTASSTTSTTSSITTATTTATAATNTTTKYNTIKQMTFENNKKASITTLPITTNTLNNNVINKKSIPSPYYTLSNGSSINKSNMNDIQQEQKRRRSSSSSGSSSNCSNNHLQGLPVNARNALLAHKTQQKQLLILQEQLQMHQRLIAQQQQMKERTLISSNMKNKLPPILGQYETNKSSHNGKSSLLKELEDKAISAP